MDSFILRLLPKIDFNTSTTTTLRQRLESKRISTTTPKINFLTTTEFSIEFLQITCLGASIYRLQKTKTKSNTISLGGVRTIIKDVRTDNCATGFPILLKFFP
jgi:hypothetical protein